MDDQPLPPDPSEWSQLQQYAGQRGTRRGRASGWQHRFTGFDYLYRYNEVNLNGDPARVIRRLSVDFASHEVDHINRVGFEYQGDYSERTWAHTTFGYRIENENGFVGDVNFPPRLRPAIESGRLRATAVHLRQAVGDRGRAFRSQQRIRQYGRAAGCADSAGVARRRIVFWNALAFFLCHRIQGAALLKRRLPEPRYLRLRILICKPERTRAFEAGIRAEIACGAMGVERNLLQ